MKLKEFLYLRAMKNQAYLDFMSYLAGYGPSRRYVLTVLLYFSFLRFPFNLPVVSGLARSVQGLLLGYVMESKSSSSSAASLQETATESTFFRSILNSDTNEMFDYIIVGSGPGAAIASQKLDPNSRVLVIEQGGLPRTPSSKHHTLEHVRNDFYKGGQELALSTWLPQFAQASVLGGGSEVNSGLYHDLPTYLLDEFLDACSLPHSKYLYSQDKVRKLLQISQMKVDPQDSPIARGAEELGYEYQNISRWRTYKENSEFTQHGMIDVAWNRLSKNANFQFALNSRVHKIDSSKKNSIKVTFVNSSGGPIEVFTQNLIIAAGAIQTPRLLCQSGLLDWGVTNFQWHPMVRTIIDTSPSDLGLHDVDPFQSWTSDRKFKFGSAVSTPGLLAMNLARIPTVDELPRLRSIYGSFVSHGKGGLIPRTEMPYYLPSVEDRKNLQEIRSRVENVVLASGATFANPNQRVKKGLSTVHIFGTLPVDSGVFIHGTSRLKVEPRIQVSDGSLLPFGPGVNPQGVVMSLCDALVTS
jgi:hypothetical protein